MAENIIPCAQGGCGLINRAIIESEKETFIQKAFSYKSYTISNADLSVFYRIADGTLSPLEGPMCKDEFYRVLDEEVICRNDKLYAWTIPIAFSLSKKNNFQAGETIAVKNETGAIIGTLEISDIYPFDKTKYNRAVYGTERLDHPGPRIFNDDPRDFLLGGKILALTQPKSSTYGKYLLGPRETRFLFKEKGWQRIVAFQTRNALHRAHEYTMVYALEELTKKGIFTGVVLNPLLGATKSDDVPADIRMKTYEVLLSNKLIGYGDKDESFWQSRGCDLSDQILLIGLDMKMFYAGPKEAIMHAIYRQNYGFTDIIIGRKHADAPFDTGEPVWGDFQAQDKFESLKGELKIKPFKVGFAAYFEEIDKVGLVDEFKKKGYHQVSISGKELRQKLANYESIDERIMRKPVAKILSDFYRQKQKGRA
ncbi:MAG: sulfate adenylyltransferase [Omnitrophica bacterium]|nr:sulfate adenylyltransferase [Candidatus Omnitrophota bacterium]